ncbi:MAG TPA: formate dehydrogenase accessory sulfurtransferase FdhD [Methanoregulaceae archaeon]|nr:MAG: formate dehydrogenase accessory sulfurtransferase FdhD [Methanolinea sp.]HON81689.1 formate dehydrogenase accessory sulfurtransferase FdhD [Methanoregulaceae archaeon]HPD10505.1 formate dehydrogenase accessory sulfurtransferase FdhD [Methanoregulaceae archaeon]HRT15523.1 formate dehydrogenase accessory sulfurtransferase FdhD [Methanoregulaceae archaeon]HRU31087.1 formate dehydrogenase accessory sulfurtransferase FdhD [Methanoregulaceae archaeon]
MANRPRIEVIGDSPPFLTLEYEVLAYESGNLVQRTVTVCQEEPVRLIVNGHELATQMVSPADLAEFACGYVISEGIIRHANQIGAIRISLPELAVTVTGLNGEIPLQNRELRTSGGLGMAVDASELRNKITSTTLVSRDTIFSAMSCLNDHAVLWKQTGGTHCTVLFDAGGNVVAHAEDIGRHNSVDKVIGKAILAGIDLDRTFITCSGRMPAGMVSKFWRSGIPIVITNNAPSAAGIDLARRVNLTLAGFVRPPRMVIYSGPERIRF